MIWATGMITDTIKNSNLEFWIFSRGNGDIRQTSINNHFGVNFWLILTEYTFQVNYNIVSTFFYIWAPTAKVIWPRKFNPKTEKCLPDSRLELTSVWYSFSSVGGITQTCPLSVVIAWNTHSFTCLRSTKLGLLFAA